VIAPAPTREIVQQLKQARFTPRDGKGSHATWTCPHGSYSIPVPDGHRTISPDVRRQLDNAIKTCSINCKEE
jgi:hypothetical protein